jgi:hypothetical protein
LLFDNVMPLDTAGPRERFEAFARSVRDVLSQRWVRTEQTYDRESPKRVYYLSMEFLIGRSLDNNVVNLLLEPIAKEAAAARGIDRMELLEQEPDAGLGSANNPTTGCGGLTRGRSSASTRPCRSRSTAPSSCAPGPCGRCPVVRPA